ncbi:winged helix family transcriptional regulator [Enterococcus sp. 5H]|uniref:winged helix family transcriptional regulator n=1 Tax=Enterococcus sp. 5H TaxID=1229490 RepID=UPI002303544E|nr:winged helix family transcriptional regulator [Enterococcus sp. 5H]MDA9471662.1 transcriptional regulator [Enterococcus sp. 5H]
MHNIKFVLLNEEDKEKYIELKKDNELNIELINKNEAAELTDNGDIIIINEQQLQNIGVVCELIILLKKKSDAFIWIISEQIHKMNHIVYLQLGVDGILDSKSDPIISKLLITNALNRYKNHQGQKSQLKKMDKDSGLELLPSNFSILLQGKEISLTKLEFRTIEFLQSQQGVAVSYEEIYKNVWDEDGQGKQYRVSNLIFHLRQKIEEDTARPEYIKTIRSKGYMLKV